MAKGGYVDSYYSYSMRDRQGFLTLDRDVDVDVAIMGGGFTGVATALELAGRGVKVAICERNRIGSGASGRNGGQVTGSLSGENAMRREFGRVLGDKAADFIWDLRWRGREIIRQRIADHNIACDFQAGHIEVALTRGHAKEIAALYDEIREHGNPDVVELLDVAAVSDLVGSERYLNGLFNPRNFHLHPLDLCIAEARLAESQGALIYENAKVTKIIRRNRPQMVTAGGTITADKILIAGNYSTIMRSEKTTGFIMPATLGMIATAPLEPEQLASVLRGRTAVYDRRFVLDYYRLSADDRLLFGGGTNYTALPTLDLRRTLRPSMERTFPQLTDIPIDFAWLGHDGIVLNRIPHLGREGDNIFFARGYSGHGIGLSHLVAEIMAEAITGDPRELDLFEQVRHLRLVMPQFMASALLAAGMVYYRMRDRLRGR